MRALARSLCVLVLFCMTVTQGFSQTEKKKVHRKGEFYFSWGYNGEWYTHSTVQINQPSLGNNYSFVDISAHDHPGWNDGIFNKAISIPQYNYRVGYLFDAEKGLGFEINFDHTKYIFADQNAKIKGVLFNHPVDSTIAFNEANGFYYYLNNGANFLLFNFVKLWPVYHTRNDELKIDFLGKVGVGPVIPHVQNSLFGQANTPHFQFGGWNTGIEAALRLTFFQYVYLEYTNKLDYARYSGLKIYEGDAKQAFGTYEMILNLGLSFPVGKKLP
jgi:hypothetical protein